MSAAPRLGTVAARGAAVTLGGQGARLLLQLTSVAVLARLLSPRDYGLVAMVVVVIGVGEISRDFGLSTAAIQAARLSDRQRDNLFWVNTALGAVLALLLVVASPLVAEFFDRPELVGISRVLALTFLLNGLSAQYRAGLNRALRFGRLVVSDVSAQLVGLLVGVVLALSGAGYWALVGQQLGQGAAALALVALAGRWRPRRPTRGADMRAFFSFGWQLAAGQLVNYAGRNADTFVIGHRFGASDLGVYNRAWQLLMVPLSQVRQPSTTVALPVLSRLQDEPRRYASYLVAGQLAFGYTLVPALGLAVGAASPLVALFLGDQWGAAVPLLQALAFGGLFETLAYVAFWVYLSRGLTAALLRYSTASAVLKGVLVLLGSRYGLEGVAAGFALGAALDWPLGMWWLSRFTPLPLRELVTGALRCAGLAVTAGAGALLVVRALDAEPAVVVLAAAALAGLAVYALAALVSGRVRRDLREVAGIATRLRRP